MSSQTNIKNEPNDGVMVDALCMKTQFKRNGKFIQSKPHPCHISASIELGVFSIRDMTNGIMFSITFDDALSVMVEAVDKARKLEDAGQPAAETASQAVIAPAT